MVPTSCGNNFILTSSLPDGLSEMTVFNDGHSLCCLHWVSQIWPVTWVCLDCWQHRIKLTEEIMWWTEAMVTDVIVAGIIVANKFNGVLVPLRLLLTSSVSMWFGLLLTVPSSVGVHSYFCGGVGVVSLILPYYLESVQPVRNGILCLKVSMPSIKAALYAPIWDSTTTFEWWLGPLVMPACLLVD